MGIQSLVRSLRRQIPGPRQVQIGNSAQQYLGASATKRNAPAIYEVLIDADEGDVIFVSISGPRLEWGLDSLITAGAGGCSVLSHPAPLWGAYVHERRRLGLDIETYIEPHHGWFPCRVARYVLRFPVRRVA